MSRLDRRTFLRRAGSLTAAAAGMAGLSSACALAPYAALKGVPRIGFLAPGPREARAALVDAFVDGLRAAGYVEGQSITIEWRFAPAGSEARFSELAEELVRLRVDLIVSSTTAPSLAARNATATIPIVAVSVSNPVQTGLVASLAKPGGNLTGLSADTGPEFHAKSVDLLRDVVPGLSRVVALVDVSNPGNVVSWEAFRSSAHAVGLVAEPVNLHSADDLDGAFQTTAMASADAVWNGATPLLSPVRARLAELALQRRLPGFSVVRDFADAGLLMSYGPSYVAIYRRAGSTVSKILKGSRPADLPVEQPSSFELVVNVRTAAALGLAIPASMQPLVTEWVQ